jgi:8-oxo-dGTP pyrophosphatase MutT (NUDIX family)
MFVTEQAIKDYILKAASQPDNLFLNSQGDYCLSYRNLPLKVGVSCYVIWQTKILLIKRSPLVKFSGKWGTVSGYVDNLSLLQNSENVVRDHIIQEFQEEIAWIIDESMLKYCGTHALVQPESQIHFELFILVLEQEPPTIQLNLEHTDYQWVELSQISRLEPVLITQFMEGLSLCMTA